MTFRLLKFVTIFGLLGLQNLSATTVGFAVLGSQRTGQTSAGVTLGTSSLVWVGTFANEGFDYATLNNLAVADAVAAIQVAGGWEQFGFDTATGVLNSGVTNTVAINGSGRLSGSTTDNNFGATKADYFNGDSLYVWVFNAATVGAATEMGIFRATDATSQPWNFATNAGGLSDNPTYSTNPSVAPTFAAIGGVGNTNTAGTFRTATFGAIPEPSRMMLVALGAMGVVVRRRRK